MSYRTGIALLCVLCGCTPSLDGVPGESVDESPMMDARVIVGEIDAVRPGIGSPDSGAQNLRDAGTRDAEHDALSDAALPADVGLDATVCAAHPQCADAGECRPVDASPCVSPDVGPGECVDGVDNDGDGRIDYPDDVGCRSTSDLSEHACHGGDVPWYAVEHPEDAPFPVVYSTIGPPHLDAVWSMMHGALYMVAEDGAPPWYKYATERPVAGGVDAWVIGGLRPGVIARAVGNVHGVAAGPDDCRPAWLDPAGTWGAVIMVDGDGVPHVCHTLRGEICDAAQLGTPCANGAPCLRYGDTYRCNAECAPASPCAGGLGCVCLPGGDCWEL